METNTPQFLANGKTHDHESPENPLIVARIPDAKMTPEEKEAEEALSTRVITDEERIRLQKFIQNRILQIEHEASNLQKGIRRQARENMEKQKELVSREKKVAKLEAALAEKDMDLYEREKIINQRDKIMEEMPANMDEAATRKWLEDQRRFMLATYRALAEHSTNERTRLQALARLSDEDRGQHGKDLRDDPDSGPGVFIIERGTYGIPA